MLWQVVGLVVVAIAVNFYVNTLFFLDYNKRVFNHRPGPCRRIEGIENGSEDIEFVESKKLAFITSGLVYFPNPHAKYDGKIFLYDFKQGDGKYQAKDLKFVGMENEDFHPHGLSHFILKDGTIRLFVTSHSKQFKHSVYLFDFDESKQQLKLVQIIRDEKFVRPNDIAAFRGRIVPSHYQCGSVVKYDGKKVEVVAAPEASNGIIFSRDFKKFFVSHINHRTVAIYDWDQKKKTLILQTKVPLLTAIDNFYIDKNNVLWIGSHPILKDAVAHLDAPDDLKFKAPSQVLRIQFSSDFKSHDITEVFVDDGNFIAASSVAVEHNNQLLIGSVGRQLVHCDIAHPAVANSKL
ncbi:unnamed protein product [Caenorhabditis auriculariae]|uniref:Arylesterase n=1 Tax=Caenorhabditis auriculariae TaxID=2777116 RepID=A0A8S1HD20_9PELO|nr:unnamed protein product [Caenorhabditis auriculariae]